MTETGARLGSTAGIQLRGQKIWAGGKRLLAGDGPDLGSNRLAKKSQLHKTPPKNCQLRRINMVLAPKFGLSNSSSTHPRPIFLHPKTKQKHRNRPDAQRAAGKLVDRGGEEGSEDTKRLRAGKWLAGPTGKNRNSCKKWLENYFCLLGPRGAWPGPQLKIRLGGQPWAAKFAC